MPGYWNNIQGFWRKFVFQKFKFALSSGLATAVDFGLFLLLVHGAGMVQVVAHLISNFCGMLVNFVLQKRFVFTLNRHLYSAFLISLLVSVGGNLLGAGLIWLLTLTPFLKNPFATKLVVTGLIFFYNFYFKRFAFENRFSGGERKDDEQGGSIIEEIGEE